MFRFQHFQHWPKTAPLCVHAERQTLAAVLHFVEKYSRPVHFCHVARKEEVLAMHILFFELPSSDFCVPKRVKL